MNCNTIIRGFVQQYYCRGWGASSLYPSAAPSPFLFTNFEIRARDKRRPHLLRFLLNQVLTGMTG